MKDIPHASTSPVIRPRFSFGGAKSPSFNFGGSTDTNRPHFRIGEDISDMDAEKKHYMISILVCVILAVAYCFKYKPDIVMLESQNGRPPTEVSPRSLLIYAIIPAFVVGLILGYGYEHYIQE